MTTKDTREAIARVIDQKIADYCSENGSYDPTTNHTELSDGAETYLEGLEDARDAILAALEPAPQAGGDVRAVQDVVAERQRQIEKEGWSHWHDDQYHDDFELARAAGCYALNVAHCAQIEERSEPYLPNNPATMFVKAPRFWPWLSKWWKPKSPRRDLVRAAALIIAEIERLDRAEEAK